MRTRGSVSRALTAVVLSAFLPLASAGCFGSFNLTRNVYGLNKDVSRDKWVRWLIFIPLTFVYGGASFLDAVIFNSVEFWSGDNPINVTRTFAGPGGEVAQVTPRGNGIFDAVVTERSGAVHHVTLVRSEESVMAYGASGDVIGRLALVDGLPVFEDAPAH